MKHLNLEAKKLDLLINQIQQREQVNPNQVDQVPVETDIIDRAKIVVSPMTKERTPINPGQHDDAADNVNRVEARHAVIDTEKQTNVTA